MAHAWRWQMRLRRRSGRRGQALVELSLLLPVMVLLAFAAVDLARGYSERTTVAAAAEAAVRSLAADPNADVTAAAKNQDPAMYTANACSATFTTPAPTGFAEVQVTLSCTYTPLTPLLSNIIGPSVVKVVAVARTTY